MIGGGGMFCSGVKPRVSMARNPGFRGVMTSNGAHKAGSVKTPKPLICNRLPL